MFTELDSKGYCDKHTSSQRSQVEQNVCVWCVGGGYRHIPKSDEKNGCFWLKSAKNPNFLARLIAARALELIYGPGPVSWGNRYLGPKPRAKRAIF